MTHKRLNDIAVCHIHQIRLHKLDRQPSNIFREMKGEMFLGSIESASREGVFNPGPREPLKAKENVCGNWTEWRH